jgi:site-specific DNA-cytosine methylase
MKVCDLFSGLEGWSKPFKDRGHEVVTVDNDPKFNPTICADILKLPIDDLKGCGSFQVIVAAPPCTEFCKASLPKSWLSVKRFGCNPDTQLLQKTLRIIEELNPDFWVIENVRGAIPYFKPFLDKPVKKLGSRYLWGKFPMFDAKPSFGKWRIPPRANRAAIRSKIPYSLGLNLCVACERELMENPK